LVREVQERREFCDAIVVGLRYHALQPTGEHLRADPEFLGGGATGDVTPVNLICQ
jgi:hypothetical protein